MKLCLHDSLTTIKSENILMQITQHYGVQAETTTRCVCWAPHECQCHIVSHAQQTGLILMYRVKIEGGWGDKNKATVCWEKAHAMMSWATGYRLEYAKLHLKIWKFNVSLPAGKTACLREYDLRHVITREDLYNSASIPSSITFICLNIRLVHLPFPKFPLTTILRCHVVTQTKKMIFFRIKHIFSHHLYAE